MKKILAGIVVGLALLFTIYTCIATFSIRGVNAYLFSTEVGAFFAVSRWYTFLGAAFFWGIAVLFLFLWVRHKRRARSLKGEASIKAPKVGTQPLIPPAGRKEVGTQPLIPPAGRKEVGTQPLISPAGRKEVGTQPLIPPAGRKEAGTQPLIPPAERKEAGTQPLIPPAGRKEVGTQQEHVEGIEKNTLPVSGVQENLQFDSFCTQCGKPVSSEARFCTSCGAPLR